MWVICISLYSGKHTVGCEEAALDDVAEQAQGEGARAARQSTEPAVQGDAGKLLPGDPDWLVQAPTPHGKARLRRMASMHPCNAMCLICADASCLCPCCAP